VGATCRQEKEKKRKEREEGCRGARWAGLLGCFGPGLAQLGSFQFFYSNSFPIFYFLKTFVSFAFDLQIRSNLFIKISKIQHNIVK
jgi:hypothetical protein